MNANSPNGGYSVPAVDRAARILRLLQQRNRLGVSEVATALGITRSNCFGILKTLQRHHFVTFDPSSKKYGLGLALLELGGALSRSLDVIRIARPYLLRHVEESRLSTFLVQRVSDHRLMIIDKEETAADSRLSISVGTRFSITHGASGKCMMAYLPDGEVEALIEKVGIRASTPKTITDKAQFREDLRRIRNQGYADSYEESMIGTNALAATVFDAEARPVLVLTSMGFTSALTRRVMAEQGRALRRMADEITAALGGRSPESRERRERKLTDE